jgi:hypothetical protein
MSIEPLDWQTVDRALKDWLEGAIPTLRGVIWAKQGAPQPGYPYGVLDRSGTIEEGTLDETRTSTDLNKPLQQEIELLTTGPREFVLSIAVLTGVCQGGFASNAKAVDLLTSAQSSLGKRSVLDALAVAGIAIIERLQVLDTSAVINGQWVSQASMDVRLRVTSCMTERTGYIDKVKVSSTFGNASPSINLDDFLIDAS